MSLMKRYAEDIEELTSRAAKAAWEETSDKRMAAITEVFEDCGTAAAIYAQPAEVVTAFVKAVTQAFMAQRKATTYDRAA